MQQRQIVLDTETTGLEVSQNHRIIEIGGVEIINRRLTGKHFHHYLQPDREIDPHAFEVHGISAEFLSDKPRFAELADEFVAFISGAELIIHNAPFDTAFLDHELGLLKAGKIVDMCSVLDTLAMARRLHPGQRNTLDALCKRYGISNSHRTLHGALLDAEILAEVYLAMTGGQVTLSLEANNTRAETHRSAAGEAQLLSDRAGLTVVRANSEELAAHVLYLKALRAASGGQESLWTDS